MKVRSLTWRVALAAGAAVTILWLLAAGITARLLSGEMGQVFDREMRATAERILPIIIHERRDDDGTHDADQSHDAIDLSRLREGNDALAFVLRNRYDEVFLRSSGAAAMPFPDAPKNGFATVSDHRFYTVSSPRGDFSITVGEPLSHRHAVAREMLMGLSLPLVLVIPIALAAILFAVRRSLAPVARLGAELEARGPTRLDPLPSEGVVRELVPIVVGIDGLMERLGAAFDAERAFASNAAHEMRTPVAGAIAQAQRLRAETSDPAAAARADEIEATLKRLNALSEKLMQLARAEGSRLRLDRESDLRMVLRVVVEDFTRAGAPAPVSLDLPDAPVMSDLDPDAFGILARNLIENALRHGAKGRPVEVSLAPNGGLSVRNEGKVVEEPDLARLSNRFARGDGAGDGTGLGLAIVHVVAERAGADLHLYSPVPGRADGFEARFVPH